MELTPFFYVFMLPVGLIIVVNVILYIRIIKSITCDRPRNLTSTQSRSELRKLQVQASICVFVLLGESVEYEVPAKSLKYKLYGA